MQLLVMKVVATCFQFNIKCANWLWVKKCKAVIWDGGDNGIRVYFSDIQALVQQSCVSGKVINSYTAILTVLQRNCADEDNNVDSCYFFSSICADIMRNPSETSRDKFLEVNMKSATGHRYIHYPI